MHQINNKPGTNHGPQTTGLTLHWAGRYDFFTRLLGLGVKGPNSRMVVQMADITPGERVLDVGCGTGSLTLAARQAAGPDGAASGIDASPEMIAAALKNARRDSADTHFELGLIEQMPFPDASFDVVISRLVLHHLPDDLKRRGFAEMYRVLKPGGRVFLADFTRPGNHILAHITSAVVGPAMSESNLAPIPGMLREAGFSDVNLGQTRSKLLGYVAGRK